jgi:hypothetical protein
MRQSGLSVSQISISSIHGTNCLTSSEPSSTQQERTKQATGQVHHRLKDLRLVQLLAFIAGLVIILRPLMLKLHDGNDSI